MRQLLATREEMLPAAKARRAKKAEGEGQNMSMNMTKKKRKRAPALGSLTDERDYDLVRAVSTGYGRSYSRIKTIPRTPATLSVTAMAKSAGVETADDAVDYFIHRFLRVKLDKSDRQLMISFWKRLSGGEKIDYESPEAENHLRELLHSIMSTLEFQLG